MTGSDPMTLVRLRRHLGWGNRTLSLLLALSGTQDVRAWGNIVGTRYEVNLYGTDPDLLRETARQLCRLCLPSSIRQFRELRWQWAGGLYVLSLRYTQRPEAIWTRPEVYELTQDVHAALLRSQLCSARKRLTALRKRS